MNIDKDIEILKEMQKDGLQLVRVYKIQRNYYKAKKVKQKAQAIEDLLLELEKKDKLINEAYRKANNYLYFSDSADYEVALWEVIRSLKPELAKKWDEGDYEPLKYIEEEDNV